MALERGVAVLKRVAKAIQAALCWIVRSPSSMALKALSSMSALSRRLWANRPLGIVLAALSLLALFTLAESVLPDYLLRDCTEPRGTKEYFALVSEKQALIAQVFAGLGVLLGLWFTWRRVEAAEKQVEVVREGQITERFTRAIEHLGSEKLEVRLGGIYALERIARDSQKDHWTIMEVLSAYVRERSPRPPSFETCGAENQPEDLPRPPADIQAILTVIGRRRCEFERKGNLLIDLAQTDLRGANLRGVHLEGASLRGVLLDGADLFGVHLEKANLSGASLEGANLYGAHLEVANFEEASLCRSHLAESHLEDASLIGANLRLAILHRAHLEGALLYAAIGLVQAQIDQACTDEKTVLPGGLQSSRKEREGQAGQKQSII